MTMRKHLLCASLALIGLGAGSIAAQPASTPPVTQLDAAVSVPVVKYRVVYLQRTDNSSAPKNR
jgi:hypothetical protein